MNDKKTEPRVKSKYVVLEHFKAGATDPADLWHALPTVEASSAGEAIRQAAVSKPGIYIAVPARSFQQVTVKVETRTIVKLS